MSTGTRTPVLARPGASAVRGPWPALPTAAPAAATLVVGFAVAQGTGVRALGGAVLVAGFAWCAWRAQPVAGTARVSLAALLGIACFVGSHLLAPHVGAWPAVVLVAAVLAVGTVLLVDAKAHGRR
ncbi:hypothetical protein [Cellulomonas marina]|uniref:Uncharacterized protein n=1 Tax=Cellulomonas marina TaxID=988821 RepID=A0A1I0V5A8_9CELL|nr:hypothetical protein [Cellulomonas marina]GIG28346.1 hypothetical protein Cma02nite_09460 [Cellulomonas marina]SFA71515.1 hypothetical protein SAMN05421867_101173 [Cellulomonas marina]